jgi:hypothetical protein
VDSFLGVPVSGNHDWSRKSLGVLWGQYGLAKMIIGWKMALEALRAVLRRRRYRPTHLRLVHASTVEGPVLRHPSCDKPIIDVAAPKDQEGSRGSTRTVVKLSTGVVATIADGQPIIAPNAAVARYLAELHPADLMGPAKGDHLIKGHMLMNAANLTVVCRRCRRTFTQIEVMTETMTLCMPLAAVPDPRVAISK